MHQRRTSTGPSIPLVDKDGNARIGAVDMGAYEFTSVPPMRINAGGPKVITGGTTWDADRYFKGTSFVYTAAIAIAGTTDDVLYQSERWGKNFTYNVPVEPGTYTVNLHFAEIVFKKAGERVFTINVESGQYVLGNFDIFAEAGYARAVVKHFPGVKVTDGYLTINLSAAKDNGKISAIEIVREK